MAESINILSNLSLFRHGITYVMATRNGEYIRASLLKKIFEIIFPSKSLYA